MLIRCDAIVAAVRGVQAAVLDGWNAPDQASNAALDEARTGVISVRVGRFAQRIAVLQTNQRRSPSGRKYIRWRHLSR